MLALAEPDTFDLVSLQLYESWSPASCQLSPTASGGFGADLPRYLERLVQSMAAGWIVGFELEPSLGLPNQTIVVPPHKLLLGLANGWTGASCGWNGEPCKSLYIAPDALEAAWAQLSTPPRGLFFWDVGDEGAKTGQAAEPLYMAQVFNDVLETRTRADERDSESFAEGSATR